MKSFEPNPIQTPGKQYVLFVKKQFAQQKQAPEESRSDE
jgi:hypothetical protein